MTSRPITIRPARPEDRAAVRAVNAEGAPGVAALDDAYLAVLEGAAYFRVAGAGGRVIGYAAALEPGAEYPGEEYRWIAERFERFLYVDQVAVAEEWRRAGVASALYDDLEAFAVERGIPLLACEVNVHPPNPGSLAFHHARGWDQVGAMELADGRSVTLLTKAVETPEG